MTTETESAFSTGNGMQIAAAGIAEWQQSTVFAMAMFFPELFSGRPMLCAMQAMYGYRQVSVQSSPDSPVDLEPVKPEAVRAA